MTTNIYIMVNLMKQIWYCKCYYFFCLQVMLLFLSINLVKFYQLRTNLILYVNKNKGSTKQLYQNNKLRKYLSEVSTRLRTYISRLLISTWSKVQLSSSRYYIKLPVNYAPASLIKNFTAPFTVINIAKKYQSSIWIPKITTHTIIVICINWSLYQLRHIISYRSCAAMPRAFLVLLTIQRHPVHASFCVESRQVLECANFALAKSLKDFQIKI